MSIYGDDNGVYNVVAMFDEDAVSVIKGVTRNTAYTKACERSKRYGIMCHVFKRSSDGETRYLVKSYFKGNEVRYR